MKNQQPALHLRWKTACMLMGTVSSRSWDRAGILVSGACAVQCAVLPLLLAAMPIIGFARMLDERIEWMFLAGTGVIGGVAHVRAYARDHRHTAPGLIFAVGFSTVLGTRLLLDKDRPAPIAMAVGGLLAAASHYANLHLCRCCDECRASTPQRGDAEIVVSD
jgi:hypothetical protein